MEIRFSVVVFLFVIVIKDSTCDFFPEDEEISSKILTSGAGLNQNPYLPPAPVISSNYYPDLTGSDSNGNDGKVQQHHPSISSVDMQLLAAMEKIVHRMDKIDSRVTTLENVVYYLVNKQKPEQGSCPDNFTRVDGIKSKCYHVSSLYNPNKVFDWNAASSECARLNARLVEMYNFDDFLRISQFLYKYAKGEKNRATDFWTGGLNPGLIWIWSGSGQQVELDKRYWNDNENQSKTPGCMKLSYSLRLNAYFFKGAPCSHAQNYVCELTNNNVARALATYEEELTGDRD